MRFLEVMPEQKEAKTIYLVITTIDKHMLKSLIIFDSHPEVNFDF